MADKEGRWHIRILLQGSSMPHAAVWLRRGNALCLKGRWSDEMGARVGLVTLPLRASASTTIKRGPWTGPCLVTLTVCDLPVSLL